MAIKCPVIENFASTIIREVVLSGKKQPASAPEAGCTVSFMPVC
jgi:hypothetical protein